MNNLLKFPQSSFVDKLIPKAKFVKASDTPTAVRDLLTEEFEQIRLLYVLRADTLNVESGSEVSEIDVFYFRCKSNYYSINSLCKLDLLIPRHTIYIVERPLSDSPFRGAGGFDILMQHKRRTIVAGLPKWTREVSQLQQDIEINTIGLRIEGMNLDRVYFNLLSQLSGYRVENSDSLKEIKALEEEIAKRQRQAEALQKQVRKERQFNIQIELNAKARALKKEIAELQSKIAIWKGDFSTGKYGKGTSVPGMCK